MSRFLIGLFAVISYLVFFLSFLYSVGFIGDFLVPKTINSGQSGALLPSIIVNLCLLGLFAIQHSVMARPFFKNWITRFIPKAMERSVYVLLASLILLLIFHLWQPMPNIIWQVESSIGIWLLNGLFWFGWLVVFLSTFMVNHFDLFGLRQAYLHFRQQEYEYLDFKIVGLYKLCRHPLMLGFIIAFWATPSMTAGHLLFAIANTVYILVALQFEERDLVQVFGDVYRNYQKKVPMLIPRRR